ncbi:MAG: D-aminoacylase [Bryobacteraceae bacterium]
MMKIQSLLTIGILTLLSAAGSFAQEFDLILENARIVDGMGNPWYRGDIGIKGDRISAVGNLRGRAGRRIAINGRVVAPGFIDMMGATSIPLLLDPQTAMSKLRQGITTMMAGEGHSDAPLIERTMAEDVKKSGSRWNSYAEYNKLLEKRGIGLNLVFNIGAAQVRQIVIGDEDRPPTGPELERMKGIVDQAMRDGANGVSTALIYPPGTYAKTDELVELCKVAGRYGGFYSTHMRNESSKVLDAIRESIEIGEKAGVPVHIYHLKAAGQENWPLMQKAVDLIAAARARGLDVSADTYPYIRNGLGLEALVNPRHFASGPAPFLKKIGDAAFRAELRKEVESTSNWENWYRHVGSNWDNILVAEMRGGGDKKYEGKSIAEIAKLRNQDAWSAFFDLLAIGNVQVNPKSMNEEQKYLAMRTEFLSFCTDAAPVNPAVTTGAHPRAFGTFPRILAKYVREDHAVSLEMAIRKMSSLPANRLKLYDRGRIAPGMAADLVVFDPATVQDHATFQKPMEYSTGMDYVIVNGKVAVEGTRFSGPGAGRVLRFGH